MRHEAAPSHRLTFAALLLVWLTAIAAPAMACYAGRPFDPHLALTEYSRDELLRMPEVIVEGVVEPYAHQGDNVDASDSFGLSVMRIERVWKGEVDSSVVVLFNTQSGDCTRPPPVGTRIRFGADLAEAETVKSAGLVAFPARNEGLHPFDTFVKYFGNEHYGNIVAASPRRAALLQAHRYVVYYTGLMDLPLRDSQLDPLIVAYQQNTEALAQAAAGGAKEAQLAYAKRFDENNEKQRALEAYEDAHRSHPDDLDLLLALAAARGQVNLKDEPEATLAELERRAPKTDEWRGKIAYARFAITGNFTAGWKDWSNLKPGLFRCFSNGGDFAGASFDRAELADCIFYDADLEGASFLGADLSEVVFKESILTDARYDCATELPHDLDPKAVGMIYVGGSCSP